MGVIGSATGVAGATGAAGDTAPGSEMGTSKVGSAGGWAVPEYAVGVEGVAGGRGGLAGTEVGAGVGAGPVVAGGGPVEMSGVASGARTPGGGVFMGGSRLGAGGGVCRPENVGTCGSGSGLGTSAAGVERAHGTEEMRPPSGTTGAEGIGRAGTSGAGASFVTATSDASATAGTDGPGRWSSSSCPVSSSSGRVSDASTLRCSSAAVVCPKR